MTVLVVPSKIPKMNKQVKYFTEFSFSEFIPVRSIIWFMIFTCVWFFYMMRVNMSIIILAMVEPSKNSDNTTAVPECKQDSLDISNSSISSVAQTDVPDVCINLLSFLKQLC